jgi:hypothetical protein
MWIEMLAEPWIITAIRVTAGICFLVAVWLAMKGKVVKIEMPMLAMKGRVVNMELLIRRGIYASICFAAVCFIGALIYFLENSDSLPFYFMIHLFNDANDLLKLAFGWTLLAGVMTFAHRTLEKRP